MSDSSANDNEAKLMPPPSALPFKKPSALPTKKTPKKPTVVEKKDEAIPVRPEGYGLIEEQDHEEEHQESNTNQSNTNVIPTPDEQTPNPPQERPTSIPLDVYQPPFWSSPAAECQYTLEVLRDGAIIDNIDLHSDQKPFYVFGRLPICDIVLDHQTISRYHALIQFRQNGEAYLYDLGSTHGTFVNKIQIKPKAYLKIKNGYHIKFGQSTRSYIVGGGPDEEKQQEDAEELKKRIMQVQEAYKNANPKGKNNAEEQQGEIQNLEDESEFFSSKKMKEDNKKKISDFKKRLGDADDDDEFGLKKKKPTKKGEEEEPDEDEGEYLRMMRENEEMFKEFYGDDDDDQDEFYDRTKKKNKNNGVETYETLIAKEKFFNNQKAIIEREIERLQKGTGGSGSNAEVDSLDSFMASIDTSLEQEKIDKKKASLKEVEDELARIKPLIEVAKPALELQKPKVPPPKSALTEADSKKRKIDEVSNEKTDTTDDNETPVKKPKIDPKVASPAAPMPKLAPNVFEEKDSGKTKRGPVQGPTLDFLQQIKQSTSSGAVSVENNIEEDEDNNNSSNKKKKDSKAKLDPEISYEEWKPPEGQTGDGRTKLNEKYGY
jgi:pSer/pThr/pTyr-binding forkhead associated (FHA) protein